MVEITLKEWESIPKDYRSYINGNPYRLRNDLERGTILEPVKITREGGIMETGFNEEVARRILRNHCAYRDYVSLPQRAQWIAADVLRQTSFSERKIFLRVLKEDLPELLETITKLYPHRVKEE